MPLPAIRLSWLAVFVVVATGTGLVLIAHALLRIGWPFELPWTREGLFALFGLLAASLVVIVSMARLLRLTPVGAALCTIAVALTMLGALWPLLIIGTFALASTLLGRRLRRLWRDAADPNSDELVALVLGAASYATLIGLLAHWPVNNAAIYAVLIALPIIVDRRAAWVLLRTCLAQIRSGGAPAPPVAWIVATLAIVYTIVALFPELGWDALAMHLFIPGHLVAHGLWNFDATRFAWALMPALGDWLFAIVYMFDGERGARLLNAGCVFVVAGLVQRIAAVAGASSGWSWFAAALVLATPLTFTLAASSFVDAEWAMLLLAGVLVLLRPTVPGHPPYAWITAGTLVGFSAAAKAVTLPLLPVLALLAITQHSALRPRGSWPTVAAAAAMLVAAGATPYATALALTGNPVYPFYIERFGGPLFEFWGTGPKHFSAPLTWTTIYDATIHASRYIEGGTGAPGFQWLLLLPAATIVLVATRHYRGLVLLALGVAMIAVVFSFQGYLRYLVPAFAVLTAAIAVAGTALRNVRSKAIPVFAAAAALSVVLNLAYLNAAAPYRSFPLESVVSRSARQAFLEREFPLRLASEVAARLPASGNRLAFFSVPVFALTPAMEVLHPSWYTPKFLRAMRDAGTADALARVLDQWRVRYVVIDDWWGTQQERTRLESATVPVLDFRGATIREVRHEYVFDEELLQNADLASTAGWTLIGTAAHDASRKTLAVTADSPAYQAVRVMPGGIYRNTVRARCAASGRARAQVNWVDEGARFLATSLQVFACGDSWVEKVQDIVAPANAAMAVVYASGGDSASIEIGAVSLRGRSP